MCDRTTSISWNWLASSLLRSMSRWVGAIRCWNACKPRGDYSEYQVSTASEHGEYTEEDGWQWELRGKQWACRSNSILAGCIQEWSVIAFVCGFGLWKAESASIGLSENMYFISWIIEALWLNVVRLAEISFYLGLVLCCAGPLIHRDIHPFIFM